MDLRRKKANYNGSHRKQLADDTRPSHRPRSCHFDLFCRCLVLRVRYTQLPCRHCTAPESPWAFLGVHKRPPRLTLSSSEHPLFLGLKGNPMYSVLRDTRGRRVVLTGAEPAVLSEDPRSRNRKRALTPVPVYTHYARTHSHLHTHV